MKKDVSNLKLEDIGKQLTGLLGKFRGYSLIIFLLFVLCIYAIVGWRVNTLLTAEPSPEAVSSQVKANAIPQIDPAIVKQLRTLRDNSVNVKVLFDQGRNNPFQ
jgi:hypothetical protein